MESDRLPTAEVKHATAYSGLGHNFEDSALRQSSSFKEI